MINSKKYTLYSLFNCTDDEENSILPLKKIEIPKIQRDYAQGRNLTNVKRIRKNFLSALYEALTTENQITLDFIYGNIDEKKVMIPLDGQQRLTTLYLLHWYIAKHERVERDDYQFLKNFSYATRPSARDFCDRLIDFNPTVLTEEDTMYKSLSDEIRDQYWMSTDWAHDATISSMLNMLDAIDEKFGGTSDLWNGLKEGAISFYFLPISELGATDELYIKMNSRGKPLTEFEHFKAEWEKMISVLSSEKSIDISKKIDLDWTDILWPYRNSGTNTNMDDIIDDEFIRYFRFITDMIYFKKEIQKPSNDIFDIVKDLFDSDNPDAMKNVEYVEGAFDCWKGLNIDDFFNKFVSTTHESGKSVISEPLNVFKECCSKCMGQQKGVRRTFPIGRMVLLYCFVFYLMNKDKISEGSFERRLRIITNLIKGSEFELREDNMLNLINQTEYVLLNGCIEPESKGFGSNQLIEEQEKVEWLKDNPDKKEELFELEDHPLLQGATRILGLGHLDYKDRFMSLFDCDRLLVNKALLSVGDYSMFVNWRYQIGSSSNDTTWRAIFRNEKNDMAEAHNVMISLLNKEDKFDNDKLQKIIDDYLQTETIYDWRHYLIKYDSMRPERYGMYCWTSNHSDTRDKSSYDVLMMYTEKSISGKNQHIFIKALYEMLKEKNSELAISIGDYAFYEGDYSLHLDFVDKYLEFKQNKIIIYSYVENEEGINEQQIDKEQFINQNSDGRDVEDRVEMAYNMVKEMMAI